MRQDLLFALDAPRIEIPGFQLIADYVAPEEERELLAHVEHGPWESDWRRRIQQYGLGYAGKHGAEAEWLRDFPDWLKPLAERVATDAHFDHFPDNCVINEYIPPLGIGAHKDYPAFGPRVACVSLGSDIVMEFTSPDASNTIPIVVPARSFWVISGLDRTEWLHGIPSRLNDDISGVRQRRDRRVSITFRTAAAAAS